MCFKIINIILIIIIIIYGPIPKLISIESYK